MSDNLWSYITISSGMYIDLSLWSKYHNNIFLSGGDPNDQSTSMFDCGNNAVIPLSQVCDGVNDCLVVGGRSGDDETVAICDSKLGREGGRARAEGRVYM